MLLFTLIFTLKTNMSYKITPLSTTNRPIFQKITKKNLFSQFFSLFFPFSFLLFSVCAGMTLINWYYVLLFAFQFEDCSGGIGAEDKIKAVDKPLSIVIKAKILVKATEIFISAYNIKADTMVQFV